MSNNFEPPKYWEFLSSDDQHIYREMHDAITAPLNKKSSRTDDFRDILEAIDIFENIEDDNKWKRCLVCGIFKVQDMIAVNICQLKSLVAKCKSSINGSLRKIGYGNIIKKSNIYELLFESIPFLKTNPSELRKWTMRHYTSPMNDNNKNQNMEKNTDINSNSDCEFSFDDLQLNNLNLSLNTSTNNLEVTNKKDYSNDIQINENKCQEYMTEPEPNEENFNFSSNNNNPSILDDKMTNWDDTEDISIMYFDFF